MLPSLRFQESQIARNEAALKTDIGQQVSQDTQQILKDYLNKLRRKPSELMPCTTSRCHRYQLVERLGALHVSIPDAVELIEISGSLTTMHGPEGKGVQHHSISRHSSASVLGNAPRATGTGHVAFRAARAADTPEILRGLTCDRRGEKLDYFGS